MTIWKDVIGFEGIYQVSNTGLVKVLPRVRKIRNGAALYSGKVLKPAKGKGYLHVNLCKDKAQSSHYVHILVATYFVEGKAEGLEVNHIDGNKLNNNDWNLEWGTHKHNQQHAFENGLMKIGINHPNSILSKEAINLIQSKYLGLTNYNQVAKEFNVPRNVAYRIMKGISYKQNSQSK